MTIYPLNSILCLAEGEDIFPLPCLEDFSKEYARAVSEDKDAPLFSKTSKYSTFPVRCPWKSGASHKGDSESKSSGGFVFPKKNGKGKGSRPVADSTSDTTLAWRRGEDLLTVAPTKIRKVDGLQGAIIRVLNKITEDNFEAQTQDLLKVLRESTDPLAVKIVAESILEKVWYDKSFYKLYVSLCRTLWEDPDWNQHSYQVSPAKKDGQEQYFYSTCLGDTQHGPFASQDEAVKKAKERIHLRSVFLSLCRDHFYRRTEYITASKTTEGSSKRYKLRRQLFGTVEIMGQFFTMGFLSENAIHYLLHSLFHENGIISGGARQEEEVEAFHLLWNVVKTKIPPYIFREYTPILHRELEHEWCSRIKFMIEDILEALPGNKKPKICSLAPTPKCKPVVTCEKEKHSFLHLAPEQPAGSKTDPKCKEETLIKKILTSSRSTNKQTKQAALGALFSLGNDAKSIKKISKLAVKIASALIKDSTEYGEYVQNHLNTLLDLLENHEKSGLSFTELSEAFSEAGEDIAELKIDAPKAPINMSFLLGKILEQTQNKMYENEILQISISRTTDVPDDPEYEKEYEALQKSEWEGILNLVKKNHGQITERVQLFSMNAI